MSTNMLCHKCRSPAIIRMRQHRLQFCKPHYNEWFISQTQRTIEKYEMFSRDDRILVAVSGGKDSLSLWDVLDRLGYSTAGLYIHLGIQSDMNYSFESERLSREFAKQRDLNLQITNVKDSYGESIPEIAHRTHRGKLRPCSVCGLVKRHVMNEVAHKQGYNVLATGHNLDDEVATLMSNTLSWEMDLLNRQSPVLEEIPGLARKAKPFCRFAERETAAYALTNHIEYIYDECPYSLGSTSLYYKELLNRMEHEQPGLKLRFYVGFLKAHRSGYFQKQKIQKEVADYRCETCGQPTTSSGKCSFCRLLGH